MLRANRAEKDGMEQAANADSAAALMILMGDALAASVMSHLDENEVQQLSTAMHAINGQEAQYVENLDQLLDAHNFPKESAPVS